MEDRHLATSINSTNELFLAIFYDNIPLVETLLAQGVNANANSQVFFDREKATKANEELLDDVVSIFSSVSDTSGNQYPRRFIGSALEAALYCGNCDAAKLLLEYGANSTTSPTEASWTAFMSPVCCGNLELIRILHRHRDDRYQNLFCHDTLNVAVESGQQEIVKFFLECGVDVHVDTLELSAKYPDSEIFSLLLESKADLDSSSYDKALLAAVWNKNPKMVRLLLGQGANVNACNSVGSPCLHIAAYLGDEKTIELLLKNGADIDSQGWPCGNALHAAAMGINQDTVNFLIGHGANITIQPLMEARKSLLHSVVEKDSIATVMALCGNGGDVYLDTQDERGHTPLHCAVINQDTRMVRYLLDRGASPDLPDFENMSPLKLALKKRLRDIVLLLYRKSKADPSSVTASELRWCSQFGDRCNLEIVGDQQPRLFFRDENLIYGLRSLRKKKYNGTLLEGQESIEIEELDLHRKERRA
ncbi:MAG: hypothetical protein LQ342_003711 [Letrouitia transgressa]|nr:MAG: hypothetical protein LQ342_003711 [Letrouitia transgressa]